MPFPSPGDLSDPGIKPGSPALQENSSPSEPLEKPYIYIRVFLKDCGPFITAFVEFVAVLLLFNVLVFWL